MSLNKIIQHSTKIVADRKKAEDTKQALLNVMEDLEAARVTIEIEKAKDEAMLASIGEGVIAVDNDKKILVMNRAAEKMLGWKMNEIAGREITCLPMTNKEGGMLPFDKLPICIPLLTNKPVSNNYCSVRKDKTRFPVSINVTPIKLGGKIIGAIEVFRDITHEIEVDRAKSEFVSLASHQLRTPLGIIKWHLEALKNEDYYRRAPQSVKKYLNVIYKNNERILDLVRDLLSVSRIEQGQIKNMPRLTNLVREIEEIVRQMKIVANKKNIALRLTIKNQRIPLINIDVTRLREIVENLIGNAITYTLNGGSVDIIVKKVGATLSISVKDTGIGISATDQKRLFTKFFKGENAILYNPEGSGLGLYVVKSYVENWGGKISVQSIEKKGSTFTICLPMGG